MKRNGLYLLVVVTLIFAMGLLMVFNTTAAEVLDRSLDRSTHQALIKQILYGILGTLGAIGVWFLGYQNILKLSGFFLAVSIILLVLVFVPGFGQQINGAHRWIAFFGYSFQPSEFVKYIIPVYFIHVMTAHDKSMPLKSFLKLIAILLLPIGLILIEPDNGTAGIILMSLFALFILIRIKWVYWALPLLIAIVGGVAVASKMQHVPDRIRVYLHPETDLKGKGHQPHQAKIAAGSGKLFGRGLAESLQKLDYLPEARSDYIAAIFAEEFGFIGMTSLILLYMLIGYLGFHIASKTQDVQGFYLVSIFTFLICFQAFLNLGVVSGLLPSKGTNLPFFSQGGSSLLANFMAMCLILNVANTSSVKGNLACRVKKQKS
ncbi:MAG TPA: putative lipid II flippase FtsW [Rhabdochlamydiaceae bacterium]|nr:putative lipid II flippase FtsW [Rhabdochlamydiaceae bacterium]